MLNIMCFSTSFTTKCWVICPIKQINILLQHVQHLLKFTLSQWSHDLWIDMGHWYRSIHIAPSCLPTSVPCISFWFQCEWNLTVIEIISIPGLVKYCKVCSVTSKLKRYVQNVLSECQFMEIWRIFVPCQHINW